MNYTFYKPSTGEIVASGKMPDETCIATSAIAMNLEYLINVTANGETHYVDLNTLSIEERPVFGLDDEYEITDDDIDSVVLTVPNPTTVKFNDQEYIVTDGTFEFTSSMKGAYELSFTSDFPYIPQTIKVNVI